jgi:hypothetical protein
VFCFFGLWSIRQLAPTALEENIGGWTKCIQHAAHYGSAGGHENDMFIIYTCTKLKKKKNDAYYS